MTFGGVVGFPDDVQGQRLTTSDLLVPYFEVDLTGFNKTTSFEVTHTPKELPGSAALVSQPSLPVSVTVFTNWGIPVLSAQVELATNETRAFNLRDWILLGQLPDRRLMAEEMAHVQAALTGQQSPKDNLYYSTEVGQDLAVGYVTIRAQGFSRPDTLWGNFFIIDPLEDFAQGDVLANIDRTAQCSDICQRHALFFVDGGSFTGGTEILVWTGRQGQPSATPQVDLSNRDQRLEAQVLDMQGTLLGDSFLTVLSTEAIPLSRVLQTPVGGGPALEGAEIGSLQMITMDAVSRDALDSYIAVRYDAESRYSAAMQSWCLPVVVESLEPRIRIEKSTNGHDADNPPGPNIAAGSAVLWDYMVSNPGPVELTNVTVIDDQGEAVVCPGTSLPAGGSMVCTAQGVAIEGQYANLGTASGFAPDGTPVTDTDPSHYHNTPPPKPPGIDLEKSTNGHDADAPPGPTVAVGSIVTWTYEVTNTGQVALTNVSVTDDQIGGISCPKSTLGVGQSMTCTAQGVAQAIFYRNEGWARGTAPDGTVVEDHDPSHYYGVADPKIRIKKATNGEYANHPPGPSIPIGAPVTWTYLVENVGDVEIRNITVTDDQGVAVSCPKSVLAPGESMTCAGHGVARPVDGSCTYRNIGSVHGYTPDGKGVSDSNPSHHLVIERPAIEIEKSTNGHDADAAPGPQIAVGDPITWTYRVTNTGDIRLDSVAVSDDKLGAVSCPRSSLGPGESMTCTADGTAGVGPYRNLGTARGTSSCGSRVDDSDPSHYVNPPGGDIDLEKSTNGHDADFPPGPTIQVGDPVTWTYVVKNTGEVRLTNIRVTDDQGVAVSCPKSALAPGESMTCTGHGTAQKGQYKNEGWAEGKTPDNKVVEDHDPSHYFGEDPEINLEKATNGHDADFPPGPTIQVGDPVTWTYRVSNTGNVALSNVSVMDDKLGAISCPRSSLGVGDSMTCTAHGTAQAGQYRNEGWAKGTSPAGKVVEDHDPSHYWGRENPDIDLEKATNGHDADSPTGPEIMVGDPVNWTYVVRNTGDVALSNVSVTDDQGVSVSCPKSSLGVGEAMTCTGHGTAQEGQYKNEGWAKGTSPAGQVVEDHDPSHYFGKRPPEPCGPCDGKVTTLTMRYLGATGAQIEVKGKKDGNTIFDQFVGANGVFTINGFDKKATLGTEIHMFVNGALNVKIHTSCSQPIGPGMTFGSFFIEAGASRNGGNLCPADPFRTEIERLASWLAPPMTATVGSPEANAS